MIELIFVVTSTVISYVDYTITQATTAKETTVATTVLPVTATQSKTTVNVPTCTANSFLLRAVNSGRTIEGQYAKIGSTYSPITSFTSDPLQATVFFLDPSGRLAAGSCSDPSFAAHWNGDANPYTNFWFETQQYLTFYSDSAAICQNNGPSSGLSCQNGGLKVFAFCATGAGATFVSLLTGLSDPTVAANGQTCSAIDLYPVALPIFA